MRDKKYICIRFKKISFRIDLKLAYILIIIITAAFFLTCYLLTVGKTKLSIYEILETLFNHGSKKSTFIIMQLRLPRILAGILVGFSLSVSGYFFQKVLKNPLASPDIIGVNSGASLGAVFVIMYNLPKNLIPIFGFIAALITTFIVYLLSRKQRLLPIRLILIGIAINAMLQSVISIMLVRGRLNDVSSVYRWLTGSLYSVSWKELYILLGGVFISIIILSMNLYKLRLLQLGPSASRSVGLNVESTVFVYLIGGAFLSALAVSISGPIGFIALIVPHITSFINNKITFGSVILTGVIGSIITILADFITLNYLPPGLPVGTIIAVVAAPYFLFLLYKYREMD